MSNQVKAQLPAMTVTLNEYAARADEARRRLSAFESAMAATSASWTGGAAEAFRARMMRWAQDYRAVVAALDEFVNALRVSIADLTRAEELALDQAGR